MAVKKKLKSKLLQILIFLLICALIGALIGLVLGFFFPNYLEEYILSDNDLIGIGKVYAHILALFIGYLIHILIHEFGHLVFGLLSGYSFVSFRVGSFTLVKDDDKFKIKRYNIPGTGGQCLMMPPEKTDGQFPYLIYNLGGALMNMIFSFLAFSLLYLCKPGQPWSAFLFLFAIAGIMMTITNGVPMKVGGLPNDGLNIRLLNKEGLVRESFYRQLTVNGLQSKGVWLKDMDEELFQNRINSADPLLVSSNQMNYERALERLDFPRAREILSNVEPCLDHMIPINRFEINSERIFMELIGDRDKEFIDKIYDKDLQKYISLAKHMIDKKRVLLAYQAFYLGDLQGAYQYLEEIKAMQSTYPIKAEAERELMLAEYLIERAERLLKD